MIDNSIRFNKYRFVYKIQASKAKDALKKMKIHDDFSTEV